MISKIIIENLSFQHYRLSSLSEDEAVNYAVPNFKQSLRLLDTLISMLKVAFVWGDDDGIDDVVVVTEPAKRPLTVGYYPSEFSGSTKVNHNGYRADFSGSTKVNHNGYSADDNAGSDQSGLHQDFDLNGVGRVQSYGFVNHVKNGHANGANGYVNGVQNNHANGENGYVNGANNHYSSVTGMNNGNYHNGIHNNGIHNNGIHNNGIHNNGIHNNGVHNNGIHNSGVHNTENNRANNANKLTKKLAPIYHQINEDALIPGLIYLANKRLDMVFGDDYVTNDRNVNHRRKTRKDEAKSQLWFFHENLLDINGTLEKPKKVGGMELIQSDATESDENMNGENMNARSSESDGNRGVATTEKNATNTNATNTTRLIVRLFNVFHHSTQKDSEGSENNVHAYDYQNVDMQRERLKQQLMDLLSWNPESDAYNLETTIEKLARILPRSQF